VEERGQGGAPDGAPRFKRAREKTIFSVFLGSGGCTTSPRGLNNGAARGGPTGPRYLRLCVYLLVRRSMWAASAAHRHNEDDYLTLHSQESDPFPSGARPPPPPASHRLPPQPTADSRRSLTAAGVLHAPVVPGRPNIRRKDPSRSSREAP
jgi:hypothetical protein